MNTEIQNQNDAHSVPIVVKKRKNVEENKQTIESVVCKQGRN